MNTRLEPEQAFERKALCDISFAWELRVPIILLSSGLLESRTAYDWYRGDCGAWHLRRAPLTRLGASERFTNCRVQTRTTLVRSDGICREDCQALVQLYLRLCIGERNHSYSRECGSIESDREMV